jgi:TolB-like protein
MAGEIFISYRRADQAKAKLLHDLLKQRGVDAWYDALLDAGDDWRNKTANALVAAPIFVLLFSKAAAESDDISKELAAATFQKKTVIPVRIEDIHPEGAFLYELASRNWFDAFNNTEERLALLADRLAALVKGKPDEAKAAAEKLGAQSALAGGKPGKLRGASRGWFRPWMAFAAFGMVIGLVAVIGSLMRQPAPTQQAASAQNQRTAFFGFTVADANPLASEIASSATEETYSALGVLEIGTAARGDTQGVELNAQLDKAAALGARYALGGAVRASGDRVSVNIRLDDVATRATLWQETMTGGAAQRESLPVLAAGRATNVLQCLIQIRPDMAREDASALALVTRACQFPNALDRQWITLWREVEQVAPKAAYAQVQLSIGWIQQSGYASDAERPAMLQEARAIIQRRLALEPTDRGAQAALASVDIASDRPLAELVGTLNTALQEAYAKDNRTGMDAVAVLRMLAFNAMGRNSEAARLGRSDAAAYPLKPGFSTTYGMALWMAGQKLEARNVLDSGVRRFAEPGLWGARVFTAVADGEDIAPVLAAAPPGTSAELLACWRDVVAAARARDAAARAAGGGRLLGCVRAGIIPPTSAITPLNLLGQVDAAYAFTSQLLKRSNPTGFLYAGRSIFNPASRPMRADPRFLPLVKQTGIYQYWLDTSTQPDVCDTPEERDIEVCRELRKDQARP